MLEPDIACNSSPPHPLQITLILLCMLASSHTVEPGPLTTAQTPPLHFLIKARLPEANSKKNQ